MTTVRQIFPIYTTRGDVGALLAYPHLYNRQGEWIGWVTRQGAVYSVHGRYVGQVTSERRITRPRAYNYDHPHLQPPSPPARVRPPAHFPLPPLMPELPQQMLDVLDERPDLLPTVDFGDLRQDLK